MVQEKQKLFITLPALCNFDAQRRIEWRTKIKRSQCPIYNGVMQPIVAERANIDRLAFAKTVKGDGRSARKIFGLVGRYRLRGRCTKHIKPKSRLCRLNLASRQ